MLMTSNKKVRTSWAGAAVRWAARRHWGARPIHQRAVHDFRVACERSDAERLASILALDVAVVVDDGDVEHPRIRVVRGTSEAIPLLLHGMAARPGLIIDELPINDQAGLMLRRHGDAVAAVNVDFVARQISVVWIGLQPVELRHWNHV